MLYLYCRKFLEYCRLAGLSIRPIQALEIRLGELRPFARTDKLKFVMDIQYLHLAAFTAEFNNPSVHVRKSRVWTVRQFYHLLSLDGYAREILPFSFLLSFLLPPHLISSQPQMEFHYFTNVPTPPHYWLPLEIWYSCADSKRHRLCSCNSSTLSWNSMMLERWPTLM